MGRVEREVLKESVLVLGPLFRKKKKNFWEQDALLRPVRSSSHVFMERGMRIGSFVNVKNKRLEAYTK